MLVDGGHLFLVEAGTDAGHAVLAELPHRAATQDEVAAAEAVVARTAASMGREMRSDDVHELLLRNLEHPRWDDVARALPHLRQLHHGLPDLLLHLGRGLERSCGRRNLALAALGFLLHHGLLLHPRRQRARLRARSRYRQWMTHKLATWIDQFGTSGCVGCGRCITWCPVGIDITEEVRAIRDSEPH